MDDGPGDDGDNGDNGAVPPQVRSVLDRFVTAAGPTAGALAVYAAGSVASGDYRPATSDLDLVALVERPLTAAQRASVRRLHGALARELPAAARLHCAYLPRGPAGEQLDRPHPTWAHGRLLDRPVSAITRAELLAHGVVLTGPLPATFLAPVSTATLVRACRDELTGFWRPATRRPWLWRSDSWVDLGLLTVARAATALATGRLITKSEAAQVLPGFGVPPRLVAEIVSRRDGVPVSASFGWRVHRGLLSRRLVAAGIDRVLSSDEPAPDRPS